MMNYIESMPLLVIFTCVSSIYFPMYTLVGIYLIFVARIVYAIGYKCGGPDMRIPGSLVISLTTLMLLILSYASLALMLQNYKSGV